MKSPRERGPIGTWLVSERERLNLSAEEVAVRAVIPTASYRAIEAGRWKPTGPRLAALERVLGSKAPDTTVEPRPEWAEALLAQVDAIRSVVDSLAENQAGAIVSLGEVLRRLPLPDDDPAGDLPSQQLDDRHDQ
jgi:transcriptional regulator with XRE-family HTH domain